MLYRLFVHGLEQPFVRYLHLPVVLRHPSVSHRLLLSLHREDCRCSRGCHGSTGQEDERRQSA